MPLLDQLIRTIKHQSERIDALEIEVRGQKRSDDEFPDEDLLAGGAAALRGLTSREVLLTCRIINNPGFTDGTLAQVLAYDQDTGMLVDDPDEPDPIIVSAGPGAAGSWFGGAICVVRYMGMGRIQGTPRPIFWAIHGEPFGFHARLTSARDLFGGYEWQQWETIPGVLPLRWQPAAGFRPVTLGKAYDQAERAYDPYLTARNTLPVNTIVRMWCVNPQIGTMGFYCGTDPLTEDCRVT